MEVLEKGSGNQLRRLEGQDIINLDRVDQVASRQAGPTAAGEANIYDNETSSLIRHSKREIFPTFESIHIRL